MPVILSPAGELGKGTREIGSSGQKFLKRTRGVQKVAFWHDNFLYLRPQRVENAHFSTCSNESENGVQAGSKTLSDLSSFNFWPH